MSIEARSWLPADTVPPPTLPALLGGAVGDWSARWFAGEPMQLGPLRREARADLSWRSIDAGLMLGSAADTPLHIGAGMLQVPAEDRAVPDRTLLGEVAEDCLLDLRARLARLVDVDPTAEWRPVIRASGWCAAIGAPGLQLALAVTDPLFARLAASVLPPLPALPLGSGAAALAAAEVEVSAAVGRAELSVAELRALEIGDVVVLDRALVDPVPLAIDGHPLARGTARVVPAEPPFLELVQAATRG